MNFVLCTFYILFVQEGLKKSPKSQNKGANSEISKWCRKLGHTADPKTPYIVLSSSLLHTDDSSSLTTTNSQLPSG
jgi:hypothetical protein